MDLPPEILLPDPDSGQDLELVFQASVETLTVVAQDPEEEPLVFVWEIPHGADFDLTEFEEDGGVTVSTVDIPNDAVLDGATIRCTVFDPTGNDADVAWSVVVP